MDAWDPQFMARTPMLAPLRAAAAGLNGPDWPSRQELQARVQRAGLHTAGGLPLRLVAPAVADGAAAYEQRVGRTGELEVREHSWHDLFNVLAWLAWPRSKAALNARHCAAVAAAPPGGSRGPVRDALTLFDESGVVVAASDPALLSLLRSFQWRELFWERRAAVERELHVLLFGHALCEKALAPYKGITGHGLLFAVAPGFAALPAAEQLLHLDQRLAQVIADPGALDHTQVLAPLPVLGVPGWCAENSRAEYYEDRSQFRPGRGARNARV